VFSTNAVVKRTLSAKPDYLLIEQQSREEDRALWDYDSTLSSEVPSVKVLVRQAVSLSWFGLARATG